MTETVVIPTDPKDAPILTHAARTLQKGTLVPLAVQVANVVPGQALTKLAFLRALNPRPDERQAAAELPAVENAAGGSLSAELLDSLTEPVAALEQASALAPVPVSTMLEFGQRVVAMRRARLDDALSTEPQNAGEARNALHSALVAVKGFAVNTTAPKVGMLNLERIEMAPAGIERGELLATIPLAPGEQTAVTQKEWSVTQQEFTSIVTDSLENTSETGVTDNTELSQSTTTQQEHANQFNVNATVKGGIPIISGSVTSGFTSQSKESESATDSRKHATTLTQKASTRSKQEHKVTISTTTVTGTSQTTTRTLQNNSANPIRIDYFSMMRKWDVRLYRYGLRQTYDIVLPEPGASLRGAYAELTALKAKQAPFVFDLPHSDITADVRTEDPDPPKTDPPTPKQRHYLVLADQYHVPAPPPPPDATKTLHIPPDGGSAGKGRSVNKATIPVPAGYEIASITITGHLTQVEDISGRFTVEGTTISWEPWKPEKIFPESTPPEYLMALEGGFFMAGSTGTVALQLLFEDVATVSLEFQVNCVVTEATMAQWRADVWNGFYTALQTQYYADQQDIAGRISALEDRLNNVDTLTLRREESEEVMKGVLRYLLGNQFPTMPPDVVKAFTDKGIDITHGTAFDSTVVGPDSGSWTTVLQYEDYVRFVNEAIEWENVTTFLYSYFWDLPDSWAFIRDITHPDANRQAFLRSGSARVVLTIRKGWETRWANFVEMGWLDVPDDPGTGGPYWSIAQEIAAYDDRNYPGIPPANPGQAAIRLEDAVFTQCSANLEPSTGPVSIPVASSAGFLVGAQVVIDAVNGLGSVQESQVITQIQPDGKHLVVAKLDNAHVGSPSAPFPVTQPGEKGELIAEWNEYTPTSGTDIAMSSNLTEIS